MYEESKQRFCNQFLKNQDKLIALLEASTGITVDKLMVVTIVLDEQIDDIIDCAFMSEGVLKRATIKIKKSKENL